MLEIGSVMLKEPRISLLTRRLLGKDVVCESTKE